MTNNTNSEELSTMTDEELQAQLEAIQAELGRRKWAKVDDLMPHVEALNDEELAELSNRISSIKVVRDLKAPKQPGKIHPLLSRTESIKTLLEEIEHNHPAP